MDRLGIYVDKMKMDINEKKTKVLVFKKCSSNKNEWKKWFIDKKVIEEAKSYKYIGKTIKDNGLFNEHTNLIKEKAAKAFYAIIVKKKEWHGFNPKVLFHVFNHTVLPILNYGAEVWGFNDWYELEKLHLFACKYILGVNLSTPTSGVFAELGRYPLYIH